MSKGRTPEQREKHLAYMREYNSRPEVRAAKLARQRKHRATPEGKAQEKGYRRSDSARSAKAKYRSSEKGLLRKREAYARRMQEPAYRLQNALRARLYDALQGKRKTAPTLEMLGCTTKELRVYIEGLWQEGMTWENYGVHGWHIDHIVPCDSFDLSDPAQQRECFHYTNLQPLWAGDNLAKGASL
jgi:hypothetical protein